MTREFVINVRCWIPFTVFTYLFKQVSNSFTLLQISRSSTNQPLNPTNGNKWMPQPIVGPKSRLPYGSLLHFLRTRRAILGWMLTLKFQDTSTHMITWPSKTNVYIDILYTQYIPRTQLTSLLGGWFIYMDGSQKKIPSQLQILDDTQASNSGK